MALHGNTEVQVPQVELKYSIFVPQLKTASSLTRFCYCPDEELTAHCRNISLKGCGLRFLQMFRNSLVKSVITYPDCVCTKYSDKYSNECNTTV